MGAGGIVMVLKLSLQSKETLDLNENDDQREIHIHFNHQSRLWDLKNTA